CVEQHQRGQVGCATRQKTEQRAVRCASSMMAGASNAFPGILMRTEPSNTIYLKDYAPPAWLVDTVDLHVAIHQGHAEVRARLACRRNPQGAGGALVLNGEALALQGVSLDGGVLPASRYALADDTLTIVGDESGPLPD